MNLLGRASHLVGEACRQVAAIANRCPPATCRNCGRRFTNDDHVRIEGNGVWRNGKLVKVGAEYVHAGPCRGYALTERAEQEQAGPEWLSECCGAPPHATTPNVSADNPAGKCSRCGNNTGFEQQGQ